MRKTIGIYLFLFSQVMVLAQFTPLQKRQLDSLNAIVKNPSAPDTSVAGALMNLSDILYVLSIDTMIPICERSRQIAEKALTKKGISQAEKKSYYHTLGSDYNNLAVAWKNRGHSNLALEYHLKGLYYRQLCNDEKEVAQSYGNLGQVYDDMGQIGKALDCYQRCIVVAERLHDTGNIILALSNIAYLYRGQGEHKKAIEYYKQCVDLSTQLGENYPLSFSLVNLGGICLFLHDTDNAKKYLEQALEIQKKIGNRHGMAYTLSHLAQVNFWRGDFERANEMHLQALKLREDEKDKEGIVKSLNALTWIHLKRDVRKAEAYALKAMELARNLKYPVEIKNAADHLKQIYEKEGRYKEALAMSDLYYKMRDSIQNGELKVAAVRTSIKNEFEKKEAVMKAAVKLEMEKKEVEQKEVHLRKNLVLIFTLLLLATVSVSAVLVFKRFRLTQNQKNIIEEQKHLVEEKQKEVMDSINYAKRIQMALMPDEMRVMKEMQKTKNK